MSTDIKRLPADWSKDLGLTVLDPDGWRADGMPWGVAITEQDFRRRAAMSTMREVATPAPLDPSKVKAGDTVTLVQDGTSVAGPVENIEEDPETVGFAISHVGWKYLRKNVVVQQEGIWTLTAHQSAVEPEPVLEPGTVAVVVQGGDPGAGVDDHEFRAALQTDGTWVGLAGEAATAAPVSVRPLVVIDPAAVDVDALANALRREWTGKDFGVTFSWDAIAATVLHELGIEAS